ncbi:MAG TPA: LysM peptidoglycan-binding domain-containing protein [Acidobacteriota bacterium]|nr:LysM peptidoglycan-binding domain-containing protein [Acidobacteriota bacterium]HNR37470.1 LysM peptidoglycan-binding domain-containing protein [Acidobacteriota bacterium]HNT99665.1 LysM peptidoglycan-binding domain-containing protein [Acidobacteriota bacterium]HPB27065.1 LysM peptidoglycan-binding domain-containing protein [Acidobacteriota bacterium]HQO25480.1 LysM peptidoglycan-binding domain-containing protein [Acidobacteriota bacterium]
MSKIAKIVLLLSLLTAVAVSQTVQAPATNVPAQGTPLKNLSKQQDGHWSPYTAPEFGQEARVHVVQRGDTLWDLARQYLNNPYLWPQIWELNTYVTNPHWIYPGDPLLIEQPKLVEQPEVPAEPEVVAEEPVEGMGALKKQLPPTKFERKPLELVVKDIDTYYATDYELYGTGRINQTPMIFDTFIVGAEDENIQRYFNEGEIVYINKGMRQNVSPGQRFSILRSAGEIHNPVTSAFVGYYYLELGTLKVLIAHDDKAIAQIDLATRAVHIGDALVPFQETDKLVRDKARKPQRFIEDNGKATGNIVYIEDSLSVAGSGNVVYLNLGRNQNVAPGQICTVYRVEGKYKQTDEFYPSNRYDSYKENVEPGFKAASHAATVKREIPRIILGEVVIIQVFENTAKAKVIDSRQSLDLGNYIQLQ